MLSGQIFLTPANAKTLYDRRYRNLIDFEITSDLSFIVAFYEYSQIVIWRINTHYKESEIQATMREITCVSISPNNKHFAIGGHSPCIIQIFEIKGKTNQLTLRHHATIIENICFSQNSQYLFSISKDYIIAVWNLKEQSVISIKLTDRAYFLSYLLAGPTTAQIFNKFANKLSLNKELRIKITIFNNLITQISSNSFKILTWHKKIIRCKKNISNIIQAKFVKENKLLYIKLDNESVIIFQTATMRLLTSIANEYGFQKIKLVASATNLMVIGFNMFGIKCWDIR